jgi:hypothetical protein
MLIFSAGRLRIEKRSSTDQAMMHEVSIFRLYYSGHSLRAHTRNRQQERINWCLKQPCQSPARIAANAAHMLLIMMKPISKYPPVSMLCPGCSAWKAHPSLMQHLKSAVILWRPYSAFLA